MLGSGPRRLAGTLPGVDVVPSYQRRSSEHREARNTANVLQKGSVRQEVQKAQERHAGMKTFHELAKGYVTFGRVASSWVATISWCGS